MGQKMVCFGQSRPTRSRQDELIEVGEVGSKRPSLGCNGVHVVRCSGLIFWLLLACRTSVHTASYGRSNFIQKKTQVAFKTTTRINVRSKRSQPAPGGSEVAGSAQGVAGADKYNLDGWSPPSAGPVNSPGASPHQ
jgi:hypothetical protein